MSARSEADPQLGRTLGGQYRIEALLGAGGMGRVYRGRQLSVNRAVAIKLIAGSAPYPPEWVSRFRREAEATASLSHPNSVRLFDFGVTESEELFMVMELLEGTDLARQLSAHGSLPVVTALSIARQVLLALCEAHALGITHRDIKPDNIFLASVRGADVVAKVMDFGIAGLAQAQQKSRLTGTGVIIGTPLYMSPEQAQGLPVDSKSDLYSLGVVLFEMLTGRPIFESNTAVTLLLAHVARAPMRLDEAAVQLREQASLQALLDRLLAKDAAQRPSAAEALDSVTTLSARLGIASATGSMRARPPLPAAGSAESEPAQSQAFQAARAPSVHTHSPLRPGIIVLGAGLVLTAAIALALRWLPTLIESTQPSATQTAHAAATALEPESRKLLINSQPSSAQVFLDGAKLGTTPFELELRQDTQISVAREGYVRQLVNVPYDARSPLFVKLVAHAEPKPKMNAAASERSTPYFFSFKQESSARIEPRADTGKSRRRAAAAAPPGSEHQPVSTEPRAFEPSVLVTREPDELSASAPLAAADAPLEARSELAGARLDVGAPAHAELRDDARANGRAEHARDDDRSLQDARADGHERAGENLYPRDPRSAEHARDDGRSLQDARADGHERAGENPRDPRSAEHARDDGRSLQDARADGREAAPSNLYAREHARDDGRALQDGHATAPPTAAESERAAGARIEAVREDEVAEIALDDDERAHVSKHYGLRAFGRAVARAVGRLLIPYPDRARRAALAEMPLAYFSFREARAAYKQGALDGTGFQEAVWQLRERRRRKITLERDRYARGELSQGQYEAGLDRIWEEFWGRR